MGQRIYVTFVTIRQECDLNANKISGMVLDTLMSIFSHRPSK